MILLNEYHKVLTCLQNVSLFMQIYMRKSNEKNEIYIEKSLCMENFFLMTNTKIFIKYEFS